jgi:hypothetical protein
MLRVTGDGILDPLTVWDDKAVTQLQCGWKFAAGVVGSWAPDSVPSPNVGAFVGLRVQLRSRQRVSA